MREVYVESADVDPRLLLPIRPGQVTPVYPRTSMTEYARKPRLRYRWDLGQWCLMWGPPSWWRYPPFKVLGHYQGMMVWTNGGW